MELVLRLVQAGKRGMLVSDIEKLGTASGYVDEPNKKIDRIRKNLESAGYSVIRFRGEDGKWRLRLVERPFVPIQVSQEELPEILRLVSAYLASHASYQGGIPADVQLARSARAQSRTLIAESTNRSFEMIPLGERLLTSGRWEIVGLLPKSGTVITPRVGGRFSFALGLADAETPPIDINVDRVGTPLHWGTGTPFRAAFEVPDGAIGSVRTRFGSAITETVDVGNGWERFLIEGANRLELYKLLAQLRGNVRAIEPADVLNGYRAFLDGLLDVEPITDGFTRGPSILEGATQHTPGDDLPIDQELTSDKGTGTASAADLLRRLVLVLRFIDLHGAATVGQLVDITKVSVPQAIQLVDCFRSAYGHVFDDGGLHWVKKSGEIVGVKRTESSELLKVTGRYTVTQGQLLSAGIAALVELETTDFGADPEREELLESIVSRAEQAVGVDIAVPSDGPGPSLELHQLMRSNVGKVVSLTYSNPWMMTTSAREIVPLRGPRQLCGRWMVDAMDVRPGSSQPHPIKHFYLDYMDDVVATGQTVPIPYSERDIATSIEASHNDRAVLRVKGRDQLDWVIAVWGARKTAPSGFEAEGEESVTVDVYPPAAERLLDLFIRTNGQVRVDLPVALRSDAHERIKRIRDAAYSDE